MYKSLIVSSILAAAILSACSKKEPVQSAQADPVRPELSETIRVSGNLAYRERIALRPGLTAKVTLSDISIADRAAPVLASQEFELRGMQVPIPFNFEVERNQLNPKGRYSVRGTLIGPEGAKLWMTDTVHLINPLKAEQDLGTLMIVRTEAKRRVQVDFYTCGKVEVETRLSGKDMAVIIDKEETNLSLVPAASGSKYQSGSGADKVMFWNKGEKAQLMIGSKTYPECEMLFLK